jgi:hypothetical protein
VNLRTAADCSGGQCVQFVICVSKFETMRTCCPQGTAARKLLLPQQGTWLWPRCQTEDFCDFK